jgi:hypothetical protein
MTKRVDANQAEVVSALRRAGASVQDLHTIGKGCPDLLVGYHEMLFLMEVKSQTGKLTPEEYHWRDNWHTSVYVVRTTDDALRVIGAI